MNRSVAQHLLCFLAGLVLTATVLWAVSEKSPPLASPPPTQAPALSSRASSELVALAPAESSEVAQPGLAQRLIETALPVIRACDPQERTARWSLLLSQLRQQGASGLNAIAAFLATGEDLPLGPHLDLPGVSRDGPSTLRMAAFDQLIHSPDPAARPLLRNELLRSLQSSASMSDTLRNIGALEYLDRGTHRAAAVAAAQRIAETTNTPNSAGLTQVITHFRATELLPLAEARAIEQPEKNLSDLFAALWKVPASQRQDITERLLANPSLLSVLNTPSTLQTLDYRLPAARDHALAWFTTAQSATTKATVIEQLASNSGWSPSVIFHGDDWNPDPTVGTPGTPAQAEARLALLDELAPYCPPPFLEQKLIAARAKLEQQLTRK